jgi:ribosomal protein L40E
MAVPKQEITIHPGQTARISSPWGFPVREDVAFTASRGIERSGAAKQTERAMEKLQEPLRKILEPDEAVLYFARGQIMPGKAERYLLGVQSHYLTQSALILTNRRLLQLSLKWNGQWNRNVRSARWGDVKEGHITGLLYGKLHIEYHQGSKETYWRIPKDAARKIQLLLNVLLPASAGETSAALAMASLCPECLAELTPGVYECRRCRLKFKDEKTAVLHALLIPGGGYFYAGLNLWGVAHAFVDVGVLFSAILWALVAMGRVQPPPLPGAPANKFTYNLLAAILAIVLALDIWLAIRVARNAIRNFIPDSRNA